MKYVAIFRHAGWKIEENGGVWKAPIYSVGVGSGNLAAFDDAFNRMKERGFGVGIIKVEITYLMPCCRDTSVATEKPCGGFHWVPITEDLYSTIDFPSGTWDKGWDLLDSRQQLDEPWIGARVGARIPTKS